MLKVVRYLQGDELVASFQRKCGLFAIPITTEHQICDRQPLLTKDCPSTGDNFRETRKRCDNRQQKVTPSKKKDSNSNHKCDANGYKFVASCVQYEVGNRLLYYLFMVSAELGHEIFYITFLPCIHWNLDTFLCRRLVNMWTLVMYIGQVMKDLLKMPRPLSPPVVKLETRVNAEYGMPSTHAMAATAISFTFLFSAATRFQFQFGVGLLMAMVLPALVSLSRLYTGMHSALDVICGVLISAALVAVTYPIWDTFDRLQLTSPLSPVVAIVLALLLSYNYPELDHYSTTRGDTTIVLAAGAGCSVGYWVNQQLGQTYEPQGDFPIPFPALTLPALLSGLARFLVGVALLVLTRQVMKTTSLWVLCSWYKVPVHNKEARHRKEIQVPYKFVTYITIGLLNTILVNKIFMYLKI